MEPFYKRYPADQVNEFKQDFLLLIRMGWEMDKEYGFSEGELYHNLPEYEKCLSLFKQKYRDIILKVEKSSNRLRLRIYFKVESIPKLFMEAASKVEEVRSFGFNPFETVTVSERENIGQRIKEARNHLYITYYSADAASNTIYLKHSKNEGMVELIYDKDGIIDEKSPEFKLCVLYGLLEGYDPSIDIRSHASTFVFHLRTAGSSHDLGAR
jgi:hypothetical protein